MTGQQQAHCHPHPFATTRRACARCDLIKRVHARNLCGACYMWARAHDVVDNYPPAGPQHRGSAIGCGRRVDACRRCGHVKRLQARRLCGACYEALRHRGDHIDYEPVHRPSADLIEDYEHLRRAGESHQAIAARLGYATPQSLRTTLHAARRRLSTSDSGP